MGTLSAVSRNPEQLDLFVTGNDGCVYTSWWSAGSDWSGLGNRWHNIGGVFPLGAPVSVVSRNPNQLDLFVIGNDGCVYTSWWSAGSDWSGLGNHWRNIGGVFPVGAPVNAASRNSNQLDLFVIGNDGCVYTSWWTAGGDWSGLGNRWRNIGGIFPIGASVSVVCRNPNQLDLFTVGDDGCVYTPWWMAGSDWSGLGNHWRNIGGIFPIGTSVSAVSRDPNKLDLFVIGNDGCVYTSWWAAGSDWSGLGNHWRNIGGIFPLPAPSVALYTFSLDSFQIRNTRSRHTDTDYVAYTLAVGAGQPLVLQKSLGDLNSGTFSVGLSFGPLPVADYQPVVVNYLIVNSGHQSQADIEAALTKAATSLAIAGAQAAAKAIGAGVGTLVGASIGGTIVPILGSALGALAGWFVGEISDIFFANCDGPVAAQQTPFIGRDLWMKTSHSGVFTSSTDNPGIDSASGCGSNSDYVVNWTVRAVAFH